MKACENGSYLELVESILKQPKNSTVLNKFDTDGKTGLHLACKNNCVKVISVLIDQPEINLNVQDQEGYTALHPQCTEIVKHAHFGNVANFDFFVLKEYF